MSSKRFFSIIFVCVLIGLANEYLLWQVKENSVFLAVMSPTLTAANFLETQLPFFKSLSPIQNEFALVLPLTSLYFGLIGYWLGQICREDGILKYFTLLCLIGFLIVIHWQALIYVTALLSQTTTA